MNSRENVGALSNSTLTGYFCEDFPSRTTQSCLLIRNDNIRPNFSAEIP